MNTLNSEQKQWLAKMLPEEVWLAKMLPEEVWWATGLKELIWKEGLNKGYQVRPTEHLHLVSLVEAKLLGDQQRAYGFALQNVLVEAMRADGCKTQEDFENKPKWIWMATASQRCTALMEVMK